jgi:hypothetical protein
VFDGKAEGDGWTWSDPRQNLKPDEKKRLEEAALRRKAKRSTSAVSIGRVGSSRLTIGALGTRHLALVRWHRFGRAAGNSCDVMDPADSL